ncbi:hypothetical protein PYJP_05460 [Pyrofollis japonicus]|uniref:Reeler domain-containing protein n=1 Tax=Pyrofollis japonicus TaxID=3060460 RepID=UPI00295AB009|nr:Reeler domain-containing protein [Pyrofollis japonicus]BEP17194.1 hypothetical protein PYJP_05460 [Pyrofollis japonicus]
MKKILVLAVLAGFIILVGLAGYHHAKAMSNGAPAMKCIQCHVGADKRPADFTVEGLPQTYEPGKTYKITIKITKGPDCNPSVACGGFAVKVSGGEIIVTDEKDTFIAELPEGKVLTHTKEGSKKREWSFEWKAPSSPQPVTFEISVLAANGDGSFNGDAYAHKTFTVKPAGGAGGAAGGAGAKPIVTTTTKVVEETTTTIVPGETTTQIKEKHNTALAITVAILLFILGVAAYLLATRK